MASVIQSTALQSTRLASEKVALERSLLESKKEVRDLRQKNAKLVDHVLLLEDAQRELQAHLERLLGGRGTAAPDPAQGLLFRDGRGHGSQDSD